MVKPPFARIKPDEVTAASDVSPLAESVPVEEMLEAETAANVDPPVAESVPVEAMLEAETAAKVDEPDTPSVPLTTVGIVDDPILTFPPTYKSAVPASPI